jgi:23S rRNA pseudouridine1911/1915/1917 synthase
MLSEIRLHKKIWDLVKLEDLEYTKPEIQRNIEKYGVLIDGKMVFKRLEWVAEWQDLDFEHWPKRESGNFENIKIIRETEDYLVVFKPSNLVVQPGNGHVKDNLMSWLENKYPNQEFFLVHRLDKDTQGLLLIAKNLKVQEFFQTQFKNREVAKKYLAIVDNSVDKLWTTTHFQTRSKSNPLKQELFWKQKNDDSLKIAKTKIKPLFYCKEKNQTLVEVQIYTGRMHQIRLICEALAFPLSYDKLYHQIKTLPKNNNSIEEIQVKVNELSKSEFESLKSNIFGENDYCLLSNYLKLKSPTEGGLELSLFEELA